MGGDDELAALADPLGEQRHQRQHPAGRKRRLRFVEEIQPVGHQAAAQHGEEGLAMGAPVGVLAIGRRQRAALPAHRAHREAPPVLAAHGAGQFGRIRGEPGYVIGDALGEAEHVSPGLQTAGPEILDRLLGLPQLVGKEDGALTRLREYQVLERKLTDRQETSDSHEDFLRSCDIRVVVHEDAGEQVDRLHELALRTTQLNFTKRRLTSDEFAALVADPEVVSGYVEASDRYGDYGICGFYALHKSSGVLTDYLFSCRVLNMGIEQWLYDRLGRPELEVVGEVVSSLTGTVDWITVDDGTAGNGTAGSGGRSAGSGRPERSGRILIVGGCDLSTTADFLGGDITTEFAHPGETGAFIHSGHTETFRLSAVGLTEAQAMLVDRLPMVDQDTYRSATVVAPDYDVLVLSVLTDYTQGLYRHRQTGLVVPWNQFTSDVTDPAMRDRLVKRHAR